MIISFSTHSTVNKYNEIHMELGDESLIQSSEGKWHRRKANEKKINSRTLMQMSRLNKFEIRSMSVWRFRSRLPLFFLRHSCLITIWSWRISHYFKFHHILQTKFVARKNEILISLINSVKYVDWTALGIESIETIFGKFKRQPKIPECDWISINLFTKSTILMH